MSSDYLLDDCILLWEEQAALLAVYIGLGFTIFRDSICRRVVQQLWLTRDNLRPTIKAKMSFVVSAWTRFMKKAQCGRGALESCLTAVMPSVLAASWPGERPKTFRKRSSSKFRKLFFFFFSVFFPPSSLCFLLVMLGFRWTDEWNVWPNRACPQCRVKSSFYIPSKYWVCEGEQKEALISSFKEKSR